jgi:DNA-binding NarL/FixJ family response regulator
VAITGVAGPFANWLEQVIAQTAGCELTVGLPDRVGLASPRSGHRPDVIVVGSHGARRSREIAALARKQPAAAIVVLGDDLDRAESLRLLGLGAHACLPLGTPPETIVGAILAVFWGGRVLVGNERPIVRERPGSGRRLTPREVEVHELLRQGRTNYQIAEELHISYDTVRTHVVHILEKLGAYSREQLVDRAAARGSGDVVPLQLGYRRRADLRSPRGRRAWQPSWRVALRPSQRVALAVSRYA